ncbi:hypothetical protein LCM4573_10085 [Rhizobium sp. LCM 4573]|nr:hypothetical protein LCM4573_10085 [Rhizobium sp. LCM 4573]
MEDFSDYQWENGYHLSKNGFFVTNTFANRQAIGASKGIVVSGMHVEFDEVIFGERWITFFFNDAPSLRQAGNRAISLY